MGLKTMSRPLSSRGEIMKGRGQAKTKEVTSVSSRVGSRGPSEANGNVPLERKSISI